jgi:hypothetical protein
MESQAGVKLWDYYWKLQFLGRQGVVFQSVNLRARHREIVGQNLTQGLRGKL